MGNYFFSRQNFTVIAHRSSSAASTDMSPATTIYLLDVKYIICRRRHCIFSLKAPYTKWHTSINSTLKHSLCVSHSASHINIIHGCSISTPPAPAPAPSRHTNSFPKDVITNLIPNRNHLQDAFIFVLLSREQMDLKVIPFSLSLTGSR